MVRLELWNGAGGDREKKILRDFERLVPELDITPNVWSAACELARACRAAGVNVPATDLLIDACAREHGAALEEADGDFDLIARAVSGPSAPDAWHRDVVGTRRKPATCLVLVLFNGKSALSRARSSSLHGSPDYGRLRMLTQHNQADRRDRHRVVDALAGSGHILPLA
jgi:hypothetical protein